MERLGPWIDSHCHLADHRLDQSRDIMMAEAEQKHIHFFMQGGVGPEDWQRQLKLAATYPNKIGLCFGLHPYWVADHSDHECQEAMDLLAKEVVLARALGEVGLDLRPQIVKDSHDRQFEIFEQSLELSHTVQKPVVLHLVQAHEEALRFFELFGLSQAGGMVHSFNGSWERAQDFLKLGLFLSVGGPVVRQKNQKLRQAIRECPLEYLLLETDCPDQPPDQNQGHLNPLSSLMAVANAVAELKKMTPREILDINSANFQCLFGTVYAN